MKLPSQPTKDSGIEAPGAQVGRWPRRGWVGLALVIVFWAVNWGLPGLRTHWAFFPLWLGFCLTIDALVFLRKGTSLLARSPLAYAGLFLISAPVWWLFEVLNWRTQNWHYDGAQYVTALQFFVLASLSFSTVMPAVFGAAELASTFGWIRRLGPGPCVSPTRRTLRIFFITGWVALALMLAWPIYFFGLLWVSLYLIIEPINVWMGGRSILRFTERRDWRPVIALWVGVWMCALVWEMWNFLSYPKWIYTVPWVSFLHVFEMPLLGYLGYLPFALELYAVYHLIARLLRPASQGDYIRIAPD